MANATLRKVVAGFGVGGEAAIDQLSKESGLLQTAEAIPANHNIFHKFKRLDALPSFSISAIGTGQADTTVNSNLYQTDLKILRATQSEQTDVVDSYPGGRSQFFMDDLSAYQEGFGQDASKNLIYGTDSNLGDTAGIKGLHQYAKIYSNVTQAGGASGSRTSIFAVKYRPGKNGCGLLFNPQIIGSAGIMNIIAMNNGNPVLETTSTTTRAKVPVYQAMYEAYIGFLSTSSFDVAAITQIQDATSKKPTAPYMNAMLDQVKANASNTVIYMNRTSHRLLGELKDGKLQVMPAGGDYSNLVATWNGIPIVIDDNITDTETTTLD